MKKILLVACAMAFSACDDGGGADLGAPLDLSVPDLPVTLRDLRACTAPTFAGFSGASDVERRVDCSLCGCVIDPLTAIGPTALWAKTQVSATFTDNTSGVIIFADGSSGPAFATLSSQYPTGPFFLDGDFDLRLDYTVFSLPTGGKIALRVGLGNSVPFWEIARAHPVGGADGYADQLGPTSAALAGGSATGTLRLTRTGFTIVASADGVEVGRTLSGTAARVTLFVAVGVDGCAGDGGLANDDGGAACRVGAELRALRLASGALVDRP